MGRYIDCLAYSCDVWPRLCRCRSRRTRLSSILHEIAEGQNGPILALAATAQNVAGYARQRMLMRRVHTGASPDTGMVARLFGVMSEQRWH